MCPLRTPPDPDCEIRHLPPPRDSFSSTGKALPFMLIFLNPVGGEESVPYNVTDATRMQYTSVYSRELKESTLYTALQVDRHVNFQSLSQQCRRQYAHCLR